MSPASNPTANPPANPTMPTASPGPAPVGQDARLADATSMGAVELLVKDRRTMEDFYVRGVGLSPLATQPGRTVLGLGRRPVVVLVDAPGLDPAPRGAAGLFHTAVLFDTPAELAASLVRMWVRHPDHFEGPGDHLVSQAFYFHDPEGNGLELYWDRPRQTWEWVNGRVRMDTLSIDPNAFLAQHLGAATSRAIEEARALPTPSATTEIAAEDGLGVDGRVEHVHLQVGDVETARRFYVDALGFDITSQMGDSALFVSAGGYHHHMAMNVWNSRGAGRRGPGLGLGRVDILVPDARELSSVRERLASHGVRVDDDGAGLLTEDPWGNRLHLAVG